MANLPKGGTAGRRPIRNRLFVRMVRNRAVSELQRRKGLSYYEAQKLVAELEDETIAEAAASEGVEPPGESGGFLEWLKDHMDEIMKVVQLILTLLGAFADDPPNG